MSRGGHSPAWTATGGQPPAGDEGPVGGNGGPVTGLRPTSAGRRAASVIAGCPSADQLRSSVRSTTTVPVPLAGARPTAPENRRTASGPR